MNKHLRRALDHLWGPTGSVILHILVVVLILKLAVGGGDNGPTTVFEATMDVEAPSKVMDELTDKIDEFKDVPVVEEVVKPPDVKDFSEPPRVDTVLPVGAIGSVGGGGGGGGGESSGTGVGGTMDGSDLSDFNSIGAQSKLTLKGIYAARGGGGKKDALDKYGGGAGITQATEFAVKRSLDWLKTHQYPDGSWGPSYRVAMTGLAILAYLAHDETMSSPEYGDTVRKGLRFLLRSQRDGVFVYGGWGYPGQVTVYEHSIGTYAISEAYAMTSIPFLKTSMESAVRVIIDGQNESGSWCYGYQKGPDAPLDVSVSGWHLQALKAAYASGAENKGLHAAIESGMRGLKVMMDKGGSGQFRYSTRGEESKRNPDLCMTGIAVLCMQLAGHWKDAEAQAGMKALHDMKFRWIPGSPDLRGTGGYPLYAWYYITQARFQQGGPTWNTWNKQFALLLAGMQNQDGSWCPAPASSEAHYGPVYCTTLSALMLQVYYRFLPTYQPVDTQPTKGPEEGKSDENIVINFG